MVTYSPDGAVGQPAVVLRIEACEHITLKVITNRDYLESSDLANNHTHDNPYDDAHSKTQLLESVRILFMEKAPRKNKKLHIP